MKIHYIKHLEIEGLGSIKDWAVKNNHSLSLTRLYKNEDFPDIEEFDCLIIMGGPMSVNDEDEYPWLIREKEFIKKAIDAGKKIIGICLGAQLIAAALDSTIRKNEFKEIGWFPLTMTPSANKSKILGHLPQTVDAFHWHGETFDLPKGAVRLAESEVCKNQAFSIDDKVFGFQFHLETTEESARGFISHFSKELVEAPYIQSADEMLSDPARFTAINDVMETILNSIEN